MDRIEKIKLFNSLRQGDVATLIESNLPDIDYFIERLIPEGMITTFFGPSQQYKSTFALYLALCISTGRDALTFKLKKKGKVLWIDEEMGIIGLRHKIIQLANGLNISLDEMRNNFKYISMDNVKLDTQQGLDIIKGYVLKYNIDIVFVDSMSKVMVGDENKTQDVSHLLHDMRMLCTQLGITYVTIHHMGKAEGFRTLQSLRGSSEFGTQCDSAFHMTTIGDRVKLTQMKGRYEGNTMDTINFSVSSTNDTMILEYIGLAKDEARKAKEEHKLIIRNTIIDYILEHPEEEYKVKDIIDHLKIPDSLGRDVIYRDNTSLHHEGIIKYDGYGKIKFLTRSET